MKDLNAQSSFHKFIPSENNTPSDRLETKLHNLRLVNQTNVFKNLSTNRNKKSSNSIKKGIIISISMLLGF